MLNNIVLVLLIIKIIIATIDINLDMKYLLLLTCCWMEVYLTGLLSMKHMGNMCKKQEN
jgi:hypothetical protein